MVFEELYPNRFIQAADFKGRDVTLTIGAVRAEEMVGMKGTEMKAVLSFVGKKKEFVANRTNGEAIKLMFGRDIAAWIGKRVTLFPTEVEVAGSVEPCIRVRGSPDIDKPLKAEVKRGKKTLKISVVPTKAAAPASNGKAAGAIAPSAGSASVPSSPAPAVDPRTLPITHPDAQPPDELFDQTTGEVDL